MHRGAKISDRPTVVAAVADRAAIATTRQPPPGRDRHHPPTPAGPRSPPPANPRRAAIATTANPRRAAVCTVLIMFAVTAARIDPDDPLSGMDLGERPDPVAPDGWATVTVKAASLNHHDVWTLRGVGISADRLPIVLGCDAAGLDAEGNEVIVYSVIADADAGGGDETLDPRRSLLSERYDGTFAQQVAVPRRNLVPSRPRCPSRRRPACRPPT